MITKRGSPDDKLVHFRVESHKPQDEVSDRAKCGNGSWHLRWTTDTTEVTCPECRLRLEGNFTMINLSQKTWCYYLDPRYPNPNNRQELRVSIVIKDEAGHFPTGGNEKEPWYWTPEVCRQMNQRQGINQEREFEIVSSSMQQGRV